MNEIIKAMEERRSIRKFKSVMPPKDDLEQIIEAGLYAANGMGKQATITLAVTNKELRDKLAELNAKIGGWKEGFDPFYGAPAILIVLADKNWVNRVYDGSLVMGNMMLRFWKPIMKKGGIIEFIRPEECTQKRHIREMERKVFGKDNFTGLKEFTDEEVGE